MLLFRPVIFFFLCSTVNLFARVPICMVAPAGDAFDAGRAIVGYERGITMQCAERLQKELAREGTLQVVFSRTPGETILPFQTASFANRLGVDFFLSLHVYREEVPKPKVFIYHLVYNRLVDFAQKQLDPFAFVPVHQAHFGNIERTLAAAELFRGEVQSEKFSGLLDCSPVYGIPIKPLVGVISPAIAIELGLAYDEAWESLVEPIACGVRAVMKSLSG